MGKIHRQALAWEGWSIAHKTAIRIFLQNDLPMLFATEGQAQPWCDEHEVPVRVRLLLIQKKKRPKTIRRPATPKGGA